MKFTIYELKSRQVVFGGDCNNPGLLTQVGQAMLLGESHGSGWIDGSDQHHDIPEQPEPYCVWDWKTKTWVDRRTFDALKVDAWERIKSSRTAALSEPLITPFGVFDADAAGQESITRGVLLANNLAALGYPAAINFTLHDNTVKVLSGSAMVQVGLLLGLRVQQIRNIGTALREQINAATTAQALDAITWDANA